jgi:hydroxymethylpyrimidine pyrophosphatase-like HAD family hydrolase
LTSYQHGCDSIIELRLNTYPKYRRHQKVDVADKDLPYSWEHIQGGQVISTELLYADGEYSYYFTTPFGCDSVDSLSLRVHQTYNIKDDTIRICSDQTPYTWHDLNNIAATGDYTYYSQTVDGYDSIHTVHIVVSEVKYTTVPVAICEGSSYLFKGQALTEQGNYYDTLTTANGCDSIVTLVLTVNKPYFHNRTEHIIEGNSVEFFGESYSVAGTYTHYGVTPTGCDSTSVLQLVVHPLVDTTVVVCSTELPYSWVNKWNGQVTPLYAAGIYRNDSTYVGGERMYYGLRLIVNQPTDTTIYREICEGDTYNFNGRDLTVANEYRDTIRNVNGCDSVVILHLNVLKKYYNVIERSIYEGDTVIFRKENDFTKRYTSVLNLPFIEDPNLLYRPLDNIPKVLYFVDLARERELTEEIRSLLPRHISVLGSKPGFVELGSVGATKGKALERLAAMLGVDRKDVTAIGDNTLDLDMIEWAGTGVCVANGNERVKAKADLVIGACEDEGVAEYLESLFA